MHGISRDFMQELNDQCAIKFGQLDEYNASAQDVFTQIAEKFAMMESASTSQQQLISEVYDRQ